MDTRWAWSDEHEDYYRWELRERPGRKPTHTLIWARAGLDLPRNEVNPPVAPPGPSTVSQHQHANALPASTLTELSLRPAHFFGYPQTHPSSRTFAAGPIHYQQPPPLAAPIGRGSSPVSGLDRYGWLYLGPQELIPGESDGSSRSAEGPRIATPPTTATEAQSPPVGPLEPNSHIRTTDSDPENSDFQTTYSTPEGRYETISKPRNYFKKGRVFKAVWIEPRGEPITSVPSVDQMAANDYNTPNAQIAFSPRNDTTGVPALNVTGQTSEAPSTSKTGISTQTVHAKPRLFVVVRQKSKHCLCVPVYTYKQQATSKPGVNPEDHSPLIQNGTDVVFHPLEKQDKLKKRLLIVVEDTSVQWNPLSRINFGKVHSIEYNLKVRTIGRIAQECMVDLESSFREAIGLGEE